MQPIEHILPRIECLVQNGNTFGKILYTHVTLDQ